jgi:hypothetical protein
MTYSSGGLIEAADFNNVVGGSPANVSTQFNTVWAIGKQTQGYGQTAVSNVSVSSTVAATNWASLINNLNSARIHQSGSGSGLSAPTAGTTITYLATLTSAVSTAYTNGLSAASFGSTSTFATVTKSMIAAAAASNTQTWTTTFTFASADQARYFFNAGGYVAVQDQTYTNVNGTKRSQSIGNIVSGTTFGTITAVASSGLSTNVTATTNNTTLGYYQATTSNQVYNRATASAYYTGDYAEMAVRTNGTIGSNQDNGTVVTITATLFSSTTGSTQSPDALSCTVGLAPVVRFPETTNLANTWGAVTVSMV